MNSSTAFTTPELGVAPESLAPRKLPLHDVHLAQGARLQRFADWIMPIHYPLGILGEHRHVRAAAGLFDVSHMGQILLRPRSGDLRQAVLALETLVPTDVQSLRPGRQRYALFTSPSGGILDDLMVANLAGGCLYLVVNAARVDSDVAHLREHLAAHCAVEVLSTRTLLALQGPLAAAALADLIPAVAAMRFMDAGEFALGAATCYITRSGYTGEDGFEISAPVDVAASLVERLLEHASVKWIGLGARDSLRLEAGLCLYGHDLTEDTTPVEAALEWAIQPARRTDGARAGGFPGAGRILSQLAEGAPRRRVGLRPEGGPVRAGALLFADATSQQSVGQVTSGTFSPTAQCPVAMGYVDRSSARTGERLFAEVRAQRVPVTVSTLPFVPHRYCR